MGLFYGMAEEIEDDCNVVYLKYKAEGEELMYYKFKEDGGDGYRSYMKTTINPEEIPLDTDFNFGGDPIKADIIGAIGRFDGYRVISNYTGKEVGRFGTDYSDDYYPIAIAYLDIELINKELREFGYGTL